ncbi:signal peptidase I [Cellulomonas sp. MW4]|uniref:Signal peptidase I n=2 Tax=Cellulomonas alba TaxID=3053467 RepID=A0ABT7SIR4_9CELL|nr:signal peptidase I [Cellulomonas alba]
MMDRSPEGLDDEPLVVPPAAAHGARSTSDAHATRREARHGDGARHPGGTEDGDLVEASADRRHAAPRTRSSGPMAFLRETAIILICALALSWVVKTFFVQAFFIPSPSMHDTLIEHDRILVNKLAPGPFELHRGDIVVFKDPGGWLQGETEQTPSRSRSIVNDVLTFVGLYPQDAGQHLVKRVIGTAGDHVACAGPGKPVTVNGVALDEPYLAPGSEPSEQKFDITVPANSIWVMGDNRQHSWDSRFHQGNPGGGSVPISNVVGVAFVTVWPIERAGLLHNPAKTFEDVPAPTATN